MGTLTKLETGQSSGQSSSVNFDQFPSRLKTCLGNNSGNSFARLCGFSESLLRKYLSGESLPGIERIVAIAEAAGVSLEWLATGRGPMRRDDPAPIAVHGTNPSNASLPAVAQIHPIMEYSDLPPPAPGFCYLRILDLNAAAGHGTFISIESVTDVLAIPEKWIRQELQCNPADLAVIKVRGDSMRPTIEPGQIIVLDHTDKEIPPDGVFVLRFRGGLMVKRLQMLDDGALEVTSDNHFYKPIIFKTSDVPDDFAIIGRVVLAVNWNRP